MSEVEQPAAAAGTDADAPKVRLAPKLGLKGQIAFIMNLRMRARMESGKDADEAWLLLTPIDLERLEDLADGLDGILLAEEMKKRNGGWEKRR